MPKFTFVLFDADGTLFDYDMAEGIALRKTFEKYCFIYSEDIRNRYRDINLFLYPGHGVLFAHHFLPNRNLTALLAAFP